MLTDLQLRNFDRYRKMVPPQFQGVSRNRLETLGAYDSVHRSEKHGYSTRDFARGGAFDVEGGVGRDIIEQVMGFLKSKLDSADFEKLAGLVKAKGERREEQAADDGEIDAAVAKFCQAKGLSEEDARELMQLVNPDVGFIGDDPSKDLPRPSGMDRAIDRSRDRPASEQQLVEFRKQYGLPPAQRIKRLG